MWVLEVYTHAVHVCLLGLELRDWDLHILDLRRQSARLAAHTSPDARKQVIFLPNEYPATQEELRLST